jgi:hypothetical protein
VLYFSSCKKVLYATLDGYCYAIRHRPYDRRAQSLSLSTLLSVMSTIPSSSHSPSTACVEAS